MVAAPFPISLVTGAPPPGAVPETRTHAWKNGSFGFHDVLDLLNPLQHIPVIGSVYRWLTDDVPGNVSRIIGDGLFGGPIGLVTGALSVALKEETGKDPGEMAISLFTGSDTETPEAAVAAAVPAADSSVAASAPHLPVNTTRTASASPSPAPPLFPLGPSVKPLTPPLPAGKGSPEAAFLAQTAAQSSVLQRGLVGQRAGAARPITAPIPLQLTGAGLPVAPRRAAVTGAPSTATSSATAEAGVPERPPLEISQRMLEALDKYMQLRQERGSTVDLVQ